MDKITTFLKEMVRIDSTNPSLVAGGAGEGAMAAWLQATCENLGLEVELQETAPTRPNVIARWRGGGGGRSLLLTGHTDIVSSENMTIPPFTPDIKAGRLYGRGAIDMKGGLAAILGAVYRLKSDGFHPKGDIILGFVTDEEAYSIGTEALVKVVQADAAILTEPSDLQICVAHRGFAWLTIRTQGLARHGSLYEEGVDAIQAMGGVLAILKKMEREIFPAKTHPLLGRASVHASMISGGLGWSTYPDGCTLQIEHRLLPNESAAEVVALWEKELAAHQIEATLTLDFERPGFETERDAAIVQTLDAAYRGIMGSEPPYMGMLAWLDSAILRRAGIPTVIFGPCGEGAHAAVEYVDVASVWDCARVLAEATAAWVG